MADKLVFANHKVALDNSAFARLFVFSGSADDPAEAAGLAHLAEHLALKRGRGAIYQDLRLWAHSTMSGFTAYTTKDYTSFELKTDPDSLKTGLTLLTDLVFGCSVTETDFKAEKSIVGFEQLEKRSDAYLRAEAALYGELFEHGPYSGNSVGAADSTRALQFIPFMREFRARYRMENAFLCLRSPFSNLEISAMLGGHAAPGMPAIRSSAFGPRPSLTVIKNTRQRFCFAGQILTHDLATQVTAGVYCRLLSVINRKTAKLHNLQSGIDVYLRATVFSCYFDSRGDEDFARFMRLAATILAGDVSAPDLESAKRKFIAEKMNPETGAYGAFLDETFGIAAFNDERYRDSILAILHDMDLSRIRAFMLRNRLGPAEPIGSAGVFPLSSVSFLIDLRRLAPGFLPCRASIAQELGKTVRDKSGSVRPEFLAEGRFLKLVYPLDGRGQSAATLKGLGKLIAALAKAARRWSPYPAGFLDHYASADPIVMSTPGLSSGRTNELSELIRIQNEQFPLLQKDPPPVEAPTLSFRDEQAILSRVHVLLYLPTARIEEYSCALCLKHLISLVLMESVKDRDGDFYSYHCWTDDLDGRMLLATEYQTRADLIARTILGLKELLAGFRSAPPEKHIFMQARQAAVESINCGDECARELRLEVARAHHGRARKNGITSLDEIISSLAGIGPDEFSKYLSAHLSERCFRHLVVAGRG